MKTVQKLALTLMSLTAMVACSKGGDSSPPQYNPALQAYGNCANVNPNDPNVLSNPQNPCNPNNPSSPYYRGNGLNNNMMNPNGMPNMNSNDIGVMTAGGPTIIRARTFHLLRGYGIEDTDDSCTVDKYGDHTQRNIRRILTSGVDDFVLNFDQQGALTIQWKSMVGQVQTPQPIPPGAYLIDANGITIPNPFTLIGQPSGAYVSLETNLGFGMMRSTDRQMREDYDISLSGNTMGMNSAYATGGATFNPQFVLNGNPNQPNPNNGGPFNTNPANPGFNNPQQLMGNNINQLSVQFGQGFSAHIIAYPVNPQHVQGLYLDSVPYAGSSTVAIQGTTCTANSSGTLMRVEMR